MTKVTVLGSGIMATALTFPLTDNGHEVALVGTHLDREIIDSIQTSGVHPNLGLKVSDKVTGYQLEDLEKAMEGSDILMSGVNSFGVDWMGEQLGRVLKPGMTVFNITKGMQAKEDGSLVMIPDVLREQVGEELASQVDWAAIVGPSIAGELAVRNDTAVIFAGDKQEVVDRLAQMWRTDYYHVWTSTDLLGAEIGAATKNIYAIAAGFADGLQLKDEADGDAKKYGRLNYKAAIFAQGATEMDRFFEFLGADRGSVRGLAGVGDMHVTSAGGRNVKAGTMVGQGVPFSDVRDIHMKDVTLEGVAAIKVIGAAMKPLTERGVVAPEDFPLLRHLYAIIEEDAPLEIPWKKFFGGMR